MLVKLFALILILVFSFGCFGAGEIEEPVEFEIVKKDVFTSLDENSIQKIKENVEKNDFDFLKNEKLQEVQSLDLSNTSISDISPIKELENLRELNISNTAVKDVSEVTNLTKLRRLNISNTQVKDISKLKDLRSLDVLVIDSLEITDLSVLLEFRNLLVLSIKNTPASNFNPIYRLRNLDLLFISGPNVTEEVCNTLNQRLSDTKIICEY